MALSSNVIFLVQRVDGGGDNENPGKNSLFAAEETFFKESLISAGMYSA